MSLLAIPINPSLAPARATSQYGFADENDKRLLEAIGAIKVVDGVETLKHKKDDVAALLNWVAEGKKGDLPDLAKRLLCILREKLRRNTIDAGTATKIRNHDNVLIAEIDGILKNPKAAVECVVDIEDKKCEEKPVATGTVVPLALPNRAPVAATTARVTKDPVVPGSGTGSANPNPLSQPSGGQGAASATSAAGTGDPVAPPSPPTPAAAATVASELPADSEFDSIIKNLSAILTNPDNNMSIKKCVYVIAHLFNHKAAILPDTYKFILDTLNTDSAISEKLDALLTRLAIKHPDDDKPAAAGVVEAVAAAVAKAIGPRRYTCSEKVGCFQQLVYATCGGASLLDPLIDHLDKLVATMKTLPSTSEKTAAIQSLVTELRGYIQTKQSQLKYPMTDENIGKAIAGDYAKDGASQILRDIDNKYALLARENTNRIIKFSELNDPKIQKQQLLEELKEEERLLQNLALILEAKDENDQKIYETVKGFETNISAAIKSLESTTNVQSNIREGCGARASYYREQLAIAKQQEANSSDEKVKRCEEELAQIRAQKDAIETELRRQCEASEALLNAQIAELTGAIAEEKRRCDALISGIRAELAQSKELEQTSSAAKNVALSGKVELEARIAALEQQLRERANTTASEQASEIARLTGELAAARQQKGLNNAKIQKLNANSSLANAAADALQQKIAELEDQLKEVKVNLDKCNKQLARRANNSSTITELRAAKEDMLREKAGIEAALATVRQESAAKNATIAQQGSTITELNARIAECEEGSAVIRADLDAVRTQLVAAGNTKADLEAVRQQLAAAQARIAELDAQLLTLRAECGENEGLRREIARLTDELAAEKARCDSLAAAAAPRSTFEIGPRIRGNLPITTPTTTSKAPVAQGYIDALQRPAGGTAATAAAAAIGKTSRGSGKSRRHRQRRNPDNKSSNKTRKARK